MEVYQWPDEPKPLPCWTPLIGERQPDSDSQSAHADTERLHLGHSWELMHHSQALSSRGQQAYDFVYGRWAPGRKKAID